MADELVGACRRLCRKRAEDPPRQISQPRLGARTTDWRSLGTWRSAPWRRRVDTAVALGEHLCLHDTGDRLVLHEVDDEGEVVALLTFARDDRRRAFDEVSLRAFARYGAPAPSSRMLPAMNARDIPAFRACLSDDCVVRGPPRPARGPDRDRRGVRGGVHPLHGAGRGLLRRDAPHRRIEPWGVVTLNVFTGTSHDGAAFEIPTLACATWDEAGRTNLLALYEPRERAAAWPGWPRRRRRAKPRRTDGERIARVDLARGTPRTRTAPRPACWSWSERVAVPSGVRSHRRGRGFDSHHLHQDKCTNDRTMFGLDDFEFRRDVLATRGRRVALVRQTCRFRDGDVGLAEEPGSPCLRSQPRPPPQGDGLRGRSAPSRQSRPRAVVGGGAARAGRPARNTASAATSPPEWSRPTS